MFFITEFLIIDIRIKFNEYFLLSHSNTSRPCASMYGMVFLKWYWNCFFILLTSIYCTFYKSLPCSLKVSPLKYPDSSRNWLIWICSLDFARQNLARISSRSFFYSVLSLTFLMTSLCESSSKSSLRLWLDFIILKIFLILSLDR